MDQPLCPAESIQTFQTTWAVSHLTLRGPIVSHVDRALAVAMRPVRVLASALAVTVVVGGWLILCLLALATLIELRILTGTGLLFRSPGGFWLALGFGSVIAIEFLALATFLELQSRSPRAPR